MTDPAGTEDLRLILGLKLKSLRLARQASLKTIAERAGLSISYLSELEQGRKYPKPDKLLQLAGALGVSYDELVSSRVTGDLGRLKAAVSSGLLREFPFELFGLEREDLVRLVSDAPDKAGALIQTLIDVGRSYDLQVEHFLFAALRSYQQMHANYFEELELAASGFRASQGWAGEPPPTGRQLRELLETRWRYRIDERTITHHPELREFRSVYAEAEAPTLHVNGRLLPSQKAFILAREIGFRTLELKSRPQTSSWVRVESFAQILNSFKASYFAGALLMDQQSLIVDLEALFARRGWDPEIFLRCMARHRATPEMFLYRLTELIPRRFGLERLFFLRFHRRAETDVVQLSKIFNLSGVSVPYGLGLQEHYCRRWPGVQLLTGDSQLAVQRSRFVEQDVEFFVLSLARPLVLAPETRSSVSIGLLVDSSFKRRVGFWDDPGVARVEVGLTCERCPLSEDQCTERTAPPVYFQQLEERRSKEVALATLTRASPSTVAPR